MSTQERFRNLLLHMGKIYSAQNDTRTALLMRGLDDVVAKINPTEVSQWKDVLSDSKRILKVWEACENATAAPIMATEILSSIEEFSSAAVEVPALVISEPAASTPVPETIHHVAPVQKAVFQSPLLRAAPPPVQVAQTVTIVHKEGHIEEEEETEEEEEEEEEEAEEEAEEIVEPEEEEEVEEEVEEEGMEVEPYMYRGRNYWIDTKSKKLYAVEGEEDVGDEVGILVAGKPVFCAT